MQMTECAICNGKLEFSTPYDIDPFGKHQKGQATGPKHNPVPKNAILKVRKKTIILNARIATKSGHIKTLEGNMKYNKGDVIITGVKGEKYPVRWDIFCQTYDIIGSE